MGCPFLPAFPPPKPPFRWGRNRESAAGASVAAVAVAAVASGWNPHETSPCRFCGGEEEEGGRSVPVAIPDFPPARPARQPTPLTSRITSRFGTRSFDGWEPHYILTGFGPRGQETLGDWRARANPPHATRHAPPRLVRYTERAPFAGLQPYDGIPPEGPATTTHPPKHRTPPSEGGGGAREEEEGGIARRRSATRRQIPGSYHYSCARVAAPSYKRTYRA
jgi:hypothetical protein